MTHHPSHILKYERGFVLVILAIFFCMVPSRASYSNDVFPVSKAMQPRVQFWINVFTIYSNHDRIFLDAENPSRIYRVMNIQSAPFKPDMLNKEREQLLSQEKKRIMKILYTLGNYHGKIESLTAEEQRIYRLFGKRPKRKHLLQAMYRIRIQGGMKEAFKEGVIRSGQYLPYIRNIFEAEGIPADLAYLPHVESSFNPYAYSKMGAAGLWQFTRGTGKQYLRINRNMDERRDPLLSSIAAARLLRFNYEKLGSWPLAVTAYNYGHAGMARAVKKVRSRSLDKIIEKHDSERFGFACKNFYAEFVAATLVAKNASGYFGPFLADEPARFKTFSLKKSQSLRHVQDKFKISGKEMKSLNPALGKIILNGKRSIPSGYQLRLPLSVPDIQSDTIYAAAETYDFSPTVRKNDKTLTLDEIFHSDSLVLVVSDRTNNINFVASASDHVRNVSSSPMSTEEPETVSERTDSVSIKPEKFRQSKPGGDGVRVYGESIVVQPEETLGHFADWLQLPTKKLRELNGLPYKRNIRIGQTLRLDFSRVSARDFEEKRLAFHTTLRDTFFNTHRVDGAVVHQMQQGETLWAVAIKRFDIPLWLIMDFNEYQDPDQIFPGEMVKIPIVTPLKNATM